MVENSIIEHFLALLFGLVWIMVGYCAYCYPGKLQTWHIRHWFGERPPEKGNWLRESMYESMTNPSQITMNRVMGVAFLCAGVVVMLFSLLPQK